MAAPDTKTSPKHVPTAEEDRSRGLTVVHIAGHDQTWMPFALDAAPIVIGREPGDGGLAVPDAEMSRRHAEITWVPLARAHMVRDLSSKNGTRVDGKVIERPFPLAHGAVIRLGTSLAVYSDVARMADRVEEPGLSPRSAQRDWIARRAASGAQPVLLHGPTGSGKEVLARRIHEWSGREGPYVAMNCAALPKELIGSELFGHARGAFTGAGNERAGLFRAAEGGTLLLDEISELPPEQQGAFLRVLQEKRVRPIGSDREIPIDVRVLAATNVDLAALESFRRDLYARIAVVVIEVPGLDQRREEVLGMLAGLLRERGVDGPRFTTDAAEALLLHAWPQNVRELQSVAEHIKLFAEPETAIAPRHLPRRLLERSGPSAPAEQRPTRARMLELLEAHEGNVAAVARELGKDRVQIYRWMDALAIDRHDGPGGRRKT